MAYGYSVAGLTLAADITLPHLSPSRSTSPDLIVHVGRVPTWATAPMSIQYTSSYTDARGIPVMQLSRTAEGFALAYSDGCLFWIDTSGSVMWMTFETTLEDACTYLVGPVLSFAFRLRGEFSLHASAIVSAAGAVAFAGPHAVGKSTTAAAFGRRGFPVVTDDILRMTQSGPTWLAQPLGGIVRLWPDGESMVFAESDRLDPITPTWSKRALSIGRGGVPAADQPMPLAGVVFLMPNDDATGVELQRLSPVEAAVRLAANSSAAHLLDGHARAREFHHVAAIASCVSCALLRRPPAATTLDDTLSALELWMETLRAEAAVAS